MSPQGVRLWVFWTSRYQPFFLSTFWFLRLLDVDFVTVMCISLNPSSEDFSSPLRGVYVYDCLLTLLLHWLMFFVVSTLTLLSRVDRTKEVLRKNCRVCHFTSYVCPDNDCSGWEVPFTFYSGEPLILSTVHFTPLSFTSCSLNGTLVVFYGPLNRFWIKGFDTFIKKIPYRSS